MIFPCHNYSYIKLFARNCNIWDVQFRTGSLISRTVHFYGKNTKECNHLLANNDYGFVFNFQYTFLIAISYLSQHFKFPCGKI